MKLKLDDWQKEVVEYKGNIVVCSGRQTGKSQCIAIKAAEFVVNNPKKHVLIISVTEDQAKELLIKVQIYLEDNYKAWIKKPYAKNVLKDLLRLTNGSSVRTKAVGQGGTGARGFTIDLLIADEAAWMPDDVWPAVTPMLLTTAGKIILISTPHGRKNYFYRCYNDPTFKVWHVNSIEAIEKRPISETWQQWRRDGAVEYFKSERYRLSDKQFKQEYEGQFVEDLQDFFPDEYCKPTLIQQRIQYERQNKVFTIGVDIGRMGGDRTVFTIFERMEELLVMREKIIWDEAYLDRIAQHIIDLDQQYNFARIYLDNGGIGIGVYDTLVGTPGFGKKRVKGINNAEKIVEYNPDGTERRTKIMKEEIYANLLFLMMKKKILLFDDGDIWLSLKGAQFEYINQRGGAMMKIEHVDHNQSHLTESIVRAAMFMREKINKFNISYI